jgi:hypothetical protein
MAHRPDGTPGALVGKTIGFTEGTAEDTTGASVGLVAGRPGGAAGALFGMTIGFTEGSVDGEMAELHKETNEGCRILERLGGGNGAMPMSAGTQHR